MEESGKDELEPLKVVLQSHALQCFCRLFFYDESSLYPIQFGLGPPKPPRITASQSQCDWQYSTEWVLQCLVPVEQILELQ